MSEKRKITGAAVEHVARLARLRLNDKEKEKFGRQLNEVLLYMEKLDELKTGEVEPLAHVLDLTNVMRPDRARPGLERDEVLDNAPEEKDGFFKVPPVIE